MRRGYSETSEHYGLTTDEHHKTASECLEIFHTLRNDNDNWVDRTLYLGLGDFMHFYQEGERTEWGGSPVDTGVMPNEEWTNYIDEEYGIKCVRIKYDPNIGEGECRVDNGPVSDFHTDDLEEQS